MSLHPDFGCRQLQPESALARQRGVQLVQARFKIILPQEMPREPKAFVGKAVCGDFRDPLRFAVWQVLAPDANRLGNVADVFSTADLPRRGRARVVTPAGQNFWFVEKREFAGDANPHFPVQRVFQIGVESSQLLVSGTAHRDSRALKAFRSHQPFHKMLQQTGRRHFQNG